jgi:Lipid A 3-O-deacylase (PagL)
MLLVGLAAVVCRAGVCTADPVPQDDRHEFEFFAGYSPASATLIGTTANRRFVAAGFEYSYRCWAWKSWSLSFTAGVLPAAILLQPNEYIYTRTVRAVIPGHAVYGFGILPIGLTAHFARRHRVHPFAEARGGIVASTEPIPINALDATGLNFMFDFGGGVQWKTGDRHAVELGYKFLHISNAGTTDFNPGLDNNVFYAGFSFLR